MFKVWQSNYKATRPRWKFLKKYRDPQGPALYWCLFWAALRLALSVAQQPIRAGQNNYWALVCQDLLPVFRHEWFWSKSLDVCWIIGLFLKHFTADENLSHLNFKTNQKWVNSEGILYVRLLPKCPTLKSNIIWYLTIMALFLFIVAFLQSGNTLGSSSQLARPIFFLANLTFRPYKSASLECHHSLYVSVT